ncbi:MAG TPA: PKD domain-containing protein, partial [Bacteroidia bacterium]|nr:PKD domain-containing protein [Bacteroidia bacterium]
VNVTCNGGTNGSATGSAAGGTGPYSYSWSNTQTTQIATGLAAGNYTLTVTDATGCQDTAVATITQPAPVTITVTGGGQLCIGQNELLTATAVGGTGPYIYTWDATSVGSSYPVNPTVTTSYTVVAADANGCTSAPLVIPVKVRDSLHLVVIPVTTMCAGDTATLKALATGGDSTYTYTWMPGPVTGSSIKVSPTSTTTYTVTVTDGCNTPPVQKTIVVNLFPSRPISFSADTISGCQSICVQFTDSVAGILKTISWNFGDGSTANITNPTHCFTNPGVFSISLTVTNDSGCVVSKSIPNMITVFSNPVAKFTWSPQPVTSLDPTVTFVDQSTDNYGIVSWAWAFGDATDSLSTNKNTSHTYLDTGKFCPSLVVVNKHGCRDTVDHCLDVQPQYTIYIPNAFTPDANGVNDYFAPKGDYIKNFEMWIFDRWGQQIFHTTDIYTGWDGTIHGNRVQEDTYVYLIYATDPTNLQHSYLGRVSVVR